MIRLENGFESGNDFIAEIKPCENEIVFLKTNEEANDIAENFEEKEESFNTVRNDNKDVNAYPTLIINDKITLESENMENINYGLVDLQGKIILKGNYNASGNQFKKELNLPYLNRGMYILNLNDGTISKTIKLIKE